MTRILQPVIIGLFIFCSFISSAQITNQNLYDTIPTMPDHYKDRLTEFRKEPILTGQVIFLGNSITEGGQWQKLTGNSSIINRGIGGDVTFGILNRLDDIIIRQPAKLFILIGINDIAKDFPDNVIINNYRKIILRLKAETPKTVIYFQSMFPVNPEYRKFPQHYDKGEHVVAVNALLKDLCRSESVNFVDLYPLLLKDGKLDASCTYDGLHLNQTGYQRWVSFLKAQGVL
jgi:lysophospholipase L1-like esterase